MSISSQARARVGGATGLAGGGATVGQVNTAISDALAALTIPAAITDLAGIDLTGVATGDLLQYDGANLVPYTFSLAQTFLMPFPIYEGGTVITTGNKYASGIPVPSACTITGWRVRNTGAHTIAADVQRCPVASNTWTTISASEGPNTTLAERNSDTDLTTWTVTALAEGDSLRVVVTGTPTATESTISILLTRTLTL